MSCSLTEYRRPKPHYVTADVGWRARSAWEVSDGQWQRCWALRAGPRARRYRVARIWRSDGAWTWRVCERTAVGVWQEVARAGGGALGNAPYYTAQQAMPYADLAARTK